MPTPIKATPNINSVGPANSWRVVYNTTTKVVMQVFLSSGITRTINGLFCGNTVADATGSPPSQPEGTVSASRGYAQIIEKIATMGLTYTPPGTPPPTI
jgi:hypothetical protein